MKELISIQSELKAPKNLYNSYGNYKYRNAEAILEAVKPLLLKYECLLIINDEITLIGDRYYVKATAVLTNKQGKTICTSAFAREPLNKKGQDESQVTGAASSYARKYALNGLFAIDDTKDADALNTSAEYTQKPQTPAQAPQTDPAKVAEPIAKVQAAKTSAEVKQIYNEYVALKNVKEFYDLVLSRGKELANAEKQK
jgi:hypothetical protein